MTDPVEQAAAGDQAVGILVGLHEGRVIIGFQLRVSYVKITVERALELAEGLVDAVRQSDPEIAGPEGAALMQTEKGPHALVTQNCKLGTLPDGRVLMDFMRPLNFLRFTDAEALEMAEGLIETAKQAKAGIHVATDSVINPARRH